MTLAQLQHDLAARFPHSDQIPLAQPFVDAVAAELLALAEPGRQAPRRIDKSLLDSTKLYAVPDEALNLFPALVQAALAAFAKGPLAALPDLVGTLVRYRSLRVGIDPEEAAVLRVLRQAKDQGSGPLPLADITDRLSEMGLALQRAPAELLKALDAKKTEKTTLVREASGRWSIGNV